MQREAEKPQFKLQSVGRNLLQIGGIALVSFIFFFFISPNNPQRVGAILVCVVAGVMAAAAFWKYRRHLWFWFTLVGIALLEGGLIASVPWSKERYPGAILTPIGLADFVLVYGVLKLVQHIASQRD